MKFQTKVFGLSIHLGPCRRCNRIVGPVGRAKAPQVKAMGSIPKNVKKYFTEFSPPIEMTKGNFLGHIFLC